MCKLCDWQSHQLYTMKWNRISQIPNQHFGLGCSLFDLFTLPGYWLCDTITGVDGLGVVVFDQIAHRPVTAASFHLLHSKTS